MFVYNCGEIELCPPLRGDPLPMGGGSPMSGGLAAERGGGRGESPTHHSWGNKSPMSGGWPAERGGGGGEALGGQRRPSNSPEDYESLT